MGTKYFEHTSRNVRLVDVLELLDEKVEAMSNGVFGSSPEAEVDMLKQKVGQVQGMKIALATLLHHFGATQQID